MDDGVDQDALTAAAEHEMRVSAWITGCTRLETMRDALRATADGAPTRA